MHRKMTSTVMLVTVGAMLVACRLKNRTDQPKEASSVTVSQNVKQTAEDFRKAAEQGDAQAQFNLGQCYYNGEGVPVDRNEALNWYRKAAEQGLASAQYNLGLSFVSGQPAQRNYKQACEWFRKAAEQGLPEAQGILGASYAEGKGCPRDLSEAARWYEKAAEQGEVRSENNLAYLYQNGQGVPKDYRQAATWLRKAAGSGFGRAQNNLGLLYQNGQGVPKDFVIAYALFNLSSANDSSNSNPAAANRDALAHRMSESQIEAGQTLTRHLTAVKGEDFLRILDNPE